jgi:hypothetical protein
LETVVDAFVLFSGFEFNANLDVIQHAGVFALFSGFEFPTKTPTNRSLNQSTVRLID